MDFPLIGTRQSIRQVTIACLGFILGGCSGQESGLQSTPASAAEGRPALVTQAPSSPGRPKPPGWAGDNVLLGSWYSDSKAGAAVLDRVTLTPDRISWGNKVNGRCDSEYDVEWLPAGEGTYPDSLSPPVPGVTFMVARLTLVPQPCATGDATVQLAYPLGGGRSVYVNLYGRDGKTRGLFGELLPMPDSGPTAPSGR